MNSDEKDSESGTNWFVSKFPVIAILIGAALVLVGILTQIGVIC